MKCLFLKKKRLRQLDATFAFIGEDHSPSVPTYGGTRQHTSLGSIHAIKGHMVKCYHMCVCVQLGQGFHKQAKHFNSTTPPQHQNTTPVGFEPTRGDPIGLAGRRLNRSAKVSLALQGRPFFFTKQISLWSIFATATTGRKRKAAVFADCMNCFFCERAHHDWLECCAPFNKHGTSGLVAMTSASHAEGRQFDPGLVYICGSRASVQHCAT